MVAPTCPINKGQPPINPRGTASTLLPSIPIATDLPSLIRAVNIIRDILRNITTSLTINNVYLPQAPREPKVPGNKTYKFSPYPDWYQFGGEVKEGTIYYKSKIKRTRNKKMRAFIERIDQIAYRNRGRDDDRLFRWVYRKRPDIPGYGNEPDARPFQEDFFERVVNVHWGKKKKPPKPPKPEEHEIELLMGAMGTMWSSTYNGDRTWTNHTSKAVGGMTNDGARSQFLDRGYNSRAGTAVTAVGWSDTDTEFGDEFDFTENQPVSFTVEVSSSHIQATNNTSGSTGGGGISVGQIIVTRPDSIGDMVYTMTKFDVEYHGSMANIYITMLGVAQVTPPPTQPPKPTPPTPPE